jgi:subtilase family serine protease
MKKIPKVPVPFSRPMSQNERLGRPRLVDEAPTLLSLLSVRFREETRMKLLAVVALASLQCLNVLASPNNPNEILLRLKEKVPLEKLAQDVMDPASPRYGKFYSPEEIRDLSGPDEVTYSNFVSDLNARGYTVVNEDKTKLFITVVPTANRVSALSLLSVDSLSSSNIIENIVVHNGRKSKPRWIPMASARGKVVTTPEMVRSLYGFNPIYSQGYSGKGQHIAIATYDDFNLQDVQDYYGKVNMTTKPQVDKVLFNGTPAVNQMSAVETEVDAEFSGQLAPGASIHVFTSAANSDQGEIQLFTAILDDNRAKVANYSWGDCETNLTPQHRADMDKVFARAIAQGVNIFVASGDSGATGCQTSEIMADWPAAHPNIVAVGGTTINSNGSKDDPNETAWSGSGGGISSLFALPSWQSGLGSPFVRRSFPDVAFNADPNSGQQAWVHYPGDADWLTLGGTSIASPQWAGFLTLVNEARGSKGSLGFLNLALYSIPSGERGNLFHDVTSGDNNGYQAGPGWDAVTGWGSMKADALLSYLTKLP